LNYTVDQRKALAAIGQALPDGSYPIKTRQDLKNAIKLVGVGNAPTATVKAFCIKRAKALHAMSMIPASWMGSGSMKQSDVEALLQHFGVKGMHWGVRRSASSKKTSTDAKKAAATKVKIKTHGRQSVSNKQLKDLVARMNLEKQHTTLSRESASFTKGHEAVKSILAVAGTASAVFTLANSPLGKAVRSALKSNITRTAANVAKTGSALVVGG
jgi:hypothetical protein